MRKQVIYLRVTAQEHALIARAASAEGLGLTNWARQELRKRTGLPTVLERKHAEGRYGDQGGENVVYIRADEALHSAVLAAASAEGMPSSHWAREILLAIAKRNLSRRRI